MTPRGRAPLTLTRLGTERTAGKARAGLMLRRLCAFTVLAVVLVIPPQVLVATCNVPQQLASVLAEIAGTPGNGVCVPTSAVGSLLGFIGLTVWVYLVLVAILRAVAVLGTRARVAGAARLLAVTSHFIGGGWVRRLVDVAMGVAMVTASGTGQLGPPSSAGPPPVAVASAPASAGGGVEQAVERLAVAGPDMRLGEGVSQGERLYTVQPGDTLRLIAERELGDGDLAGLLFEVNQGRLMPGGVRLEDPDLLRPSWVLVLPGPDLLPSPSTLPPPAPPPAGTSPPPASSPQPTTTPQPQPTRPRVTVELPSGSVVAFSLWIGMSAALVLALLRSRRLRRPEPPEPGICRYRPQTASVAQQLIDRAHAAAVDEPLDLEEAAADAAGGAERAAAGLLPTSPLADLTVVDPGRVPVAERDGETVELDLAGVGVLVLAGPDAERAARAAVVTLLAQHGPASAGVLVVGDLLGDAGEFPGLRSAPDLAAALDVLEAEVLHRGRLLEAEEVNDFASHRRQHPDDPLPALVLLAEHVPPRAAGRLEALAAQGTRLGIGVLLVGAALQGAARIELDDTGQVAHAEPAGLAPGLVGAQVFTLSQAEAVDLLATLARARDDLPPAPQAPPVPEPFEPPAPPPGSPAPPLRVRLLGPYRVETTGGQQLRGGRRKALELLAFYLLNPDGATQEQAVEALWPEAPLGRESEWFWNALGSLRRAVRELLGDDEAKVIARDGDRYRPDPAVLDVDLWRLEGALAQAKRAASEGDERAETAALQAASDAYGGELLAGLAGSWITMSREDLRRRAVNALARLAELRVAAGDPDAAVAALEQAITADPVAEDLYRRVMRLQAGLGRLDAARRAYQALERHLTELDVDPEPPTEALAAELFSSRRHRSDPPPT